MNIEKIEGTKLSEPANGAIVVDTGKLKIPKGLVEEEGKPGALDDMNRPVFVITAIAMAYIIFIAYLISKS